VRFASVALTVAAISSRVVFVDLGKANHRVDTLICDHPDGVLDLNNVGFMSGNASIRRFIAAQGNECDAKVA